MLVVQYGQHLKPWESNVIWNQWRLVNGTELYDFRRDLRRGATTWPKPEPEIVTRLRAHYEKWWRAIEPTLPDYCPISIGAPAEPITELSCSDWQDIYCDNLNAVLTAQGGPRGGPWNVQVERAGNYSIELARWPFARNLALAAPCPAKQVTVATLAEGKGAPHRPSPAKDRPARSDGESLRADARAIAFQVKLAPGKTRLHGWFQDAAGQDLAGAFNARVRRLA